MDPGGGAVRAASRLLHRPHGPGLSRDPVAPRRTGAYRTMIGFVLFAVIAAVVDWSRFKWA